MEVRDAKRACAHKETMMRFVRSLIVVGAICASTSMAGAQAVDWQKVDDAFGRKAAVISGDAHRYGFPRADLSVTLDGVTIKPALALGGWVAFKPMQGGAMVMGDLVLLETEVNPVMTALRANGIEITALHSHMLDERPRLFFMHFWANDDALKLAKGIRAALDKTASVTSQNATGKN